MKVTTRRAVVFACICLALFVPALMFPVIPEQPPPAIPHPTPAWVTPESVATSVTNPIRTFRP